MTGKKKISVIIPLYNCSLLVSRALESVNNQSIEENIEVLIIDDGSTDDSVEVVKKSNINAEVIHQENQGPAVARNKGIEIASGEYIAFLDADDYWEPEFLNSTVSFMESHPEAIAVSTGQLHRIPGKPDAIVPSALKERPGDFSGPFLIDDFYDFWAEHNHVCTGSAVVRTDVAKKAGGQRSDLRITEDLEFWGYLATFGSWGFIPEVLFVSDGGIVTRQKGWIEKNLIRWRSAPQIELWEKRIIGNFNGTIPRGYVRFRGKIIRNLVYSMIMSDRRELAYQTVRKYRDQMPSDRISHLFRIASGNKFSWKVLSDILLKREYSRDF